jgi:hypothetical protein
LLPEQADRVQPAEDAERAVEATAVRDAVQVRADDDRRAVAGRPAADDVARRVQLRLEAGLRRPPAEPIADGAVLGRPREA